MRKSFTRLFSIFVLLLGLSFQMAYGIVFDPTKTIPTDGNSNAKPTDFATKFVVAFDVVPVISDAGGTAVIYKNGGLFKTFPVTQTSTSVVVVGKTLEITHGIPVSSFVAGENYTIAITDGAIKDPNGSLLANGSLPGPIFPALPAVGAPFDFIIGDFVPPALSTTAAAYAPLKGAVSVMANLDASAFSLTVPFNEAVTTPVAPGNKAVYIYKEDGTVVDIVKVSTLTVANGLGTANITVPVAATAIFQENTKYYVSIDAGAFIDISPNKNVFVDIPTPATWTFTTRDYSAPVISASISDITTTTAKLNVALTEKGKYYYLLQTEVTADPANAAAVKAAGIAVTVASANTNVTSNLTVLGSTAYEVFVVSENSETPANLSSAVVKKTFSSIDNTAPLSIARGLINTADKKTAGVYMVFNEQVKGGAGMLDLRLTSNESYVKSIGANTITSTKLATAADVAKYPGSALNQWVAVVDFGMTLPSNVSYYIVFPSGYIIDMAIPTGNVFTGGAFVNPINKPIDPASWGITSSDFELPTVTIAFVTPASLTSAIAITFNETVQKQLSTTTDWAQVVALEQNNTSVPFNLTPVTPIGAANTTVITITPNAALTSNTTYTIRLRKDAVKDLNNNAIVTENLYTLTAGDLDPLAVQYGSSVGVTTTTNLLANSTIKIDFNKAVKVNTTGTTWVAADAASLLLNNIITFKKGATAKAFTVAYDVTTFTATITPTDPLVCNAADYTVAVDGAKVRDSQSVLLSAAAGYIAIQTYTVKDYNAPIATVSHSGDVEDKPANANPTITLADDNMGSLVHLDGSALIDPSTITFKEGSSNGPNLGFTAAYAGGVITITPTIALATGKTYYYGIGASVKDGNGNVTIGKFSTFKMVTPIVAPTIVALTYTVNASAQKPVAEKLDNVLAKTPGNVVTVTVTFNDNVKETIPTNTIWLTDGTTTWPATVVSTNVSGNTLTVDFIGVTPLASKALCTLTLPAGLVQGSTAYTNTPAPTFAQFALKTIQFNSKDIVPPVVTANTPAASAVGVALNTALKLDFSEKVLLGSGNITITEGTNVQTIAVNSTNVTLNAAGTQAIVVKTDLLKYNTVYTVSVPAGAFTDEVSSNGNALTTFTFTTLVNPQPTAATLVPADNSDQLAISPLTLGMTFSEEVDKYDPLVGTRKLWYLVKNTGTTLIPGTRASFNPSNDLVAGTDVVVANNYIETTSVGISGKVVSIATGFTPVAGEKYYVLITPGAFLDKSAGVGTLGNPVPGVYAGITSDLTWNFTTKDENPGTVTFVYSKRADNKVAKTSDIAINFSRPIKKADGSVINDVDIANLFTLTKNAGPGTLGVKAFIGTISADKKTVMILNSSLVTLGEMTELSNYTISMNAGAIIYQNGSAIAGASDTFNTSDYTNPAVVASFTIESADVKKDEATVQFTATDNLNLASLYYTIQTGDATTPTPTADVVKTGSSKAIVGASPQAASNKFTGLAEKTSYVVWTVVVDEAGNTSPVSKIVFVTDDVTKPLMATLPTSFDASGKLTFVFNEAVSPVNASVRILDAISMQVIAVRNLIAVAGKPTQLITDPAFTPAITNALVNYYVEIDKGLVGDVPALVGAPALPANAVNYFDGLFRTDLMVTSKDVTKPNLLSSSIPAVNVPVNFSFTLTFDEKVKKATTLPVDALVIEKWNTTTLVWEPFEIVDPANMVSNDTEIVTVTITRILSSLGNYRATLKSLTFSDLSGNLHTLVAPWVALFSAKDIVAPTATFVPGKNVTGIAAGITAFPLTMTFSEAIRLLDNSAIDSYDLDSLVYFKKDNTSMAFHATIAGSVISVIPIAALVADATYTYGFKAKFEDIADNAVTADAATFKTVVTTPAAQYLTWLPAKASPYVAPWPWLGTSNPVTLNFSSPIFTREGSAADNNLPVTPARIVSNVILTVKQNGVVVAAADLVFTTPDNKTIVVSPKTNWGSYGVIDVIVNDSKLQINEGNVTILAGILGAPFDASTYRAQDVVAPKVDITYAAAGFTTGYYPAKVGVAGFSPVIAKSEALKLYFDEPVKVGTGTIEIHRADGVLAKPAMVATVDPLDALKRTVILGDLNGLETNKEYYVIVNAGAVVDVTDNNPYAGLTGISDWKFILKDDAKPQVVNYLPITDNQPVNTKLTINLDRPIALTGAGYVALYKSAAGGDAIQIWRGADNGTTGAFTISGNTVTVNIMPLLEMNTRYYVELSANTFGSTADMSKVQETIIARADWSFTTEGNANPAIVAGSFIPAKDATGVSLDQDLQMTFNMPVQAGSGEIQLIPADGSAVFKYDVKTQVTFANDVVSVVLPKLAEAKQYYVIIPAGAILNKTYTPEPFGGITVPFDWKFNTGDFTAPIVTANPASGNSMPLTFNVTLTFNEKVTGVSASTLTVSAGTINSVSTEATGTIYVANITAPSLADVVLKVPATVKDISGNALTETTFSYKVDNFLAPVMLTWTPADGSIGLKKDTSLVMTFSKPVMAGTGKINVYNSLNELFKSYTLTAANIVGNKVTVPITGLTDKTTYVVLLEAGTVTDLLGLPMVALTDPTKWNFTIGDNTAPTVSSVTPATSSNAATSFNVTIVFSEDVVKVAENVSITNGTVTVTGSGATYVATIKGVDGAVINMTIGTGIMDVSLRNKLATAVSKTYTIGDHVGPTLVVTPPVSPIATVFTVGLKFNEPVSGVADGITVTGGTISDLTGSGDTYTLTVIAKEQTEVTIVLSDAIKDKSPNTNKFAGLTVKYTTGDFTAPELVTWFPTIDDVLVNNHPTFKMTFSENVKLGAGGMLKVYRVATTTSVLEIPITAAMIVGKDVTVSYTTLKGLDKNTRYYVLIDATALIDNAGNSFAGVNDAAAWTFKTGANFATPVVDIEKSEFRVYPNPFVDVVNLVSSSKLSKVIVSNIAGQVVKEVVNPSNSIQLGELGSGIYFISLYTMDNVIAKTAKIVKR